MSLYLILLQKCICHITCTWHLSWNFLYRYLHTMIFTLTNCQRKLWSHVKHMTHGVVLNLSVSLPRGHIFDYTRTLLSLGSHNGCLRAMMAFYPCSSMKLGYVHCWYLLRIIDKINYIWRNVKCQDLSSFLWVIFPPGCLPFPTFQSNLIISHTHNQFPSVVSL